MFIPVNSGLTSVLGRASHRMALVDQVSFDRRYLPLYFYSSFAKYW